MSKRGVSFADSVETRTYNREDLPAGLLDDDDAPVNKSKTVIEEDDEGIPIKRSKHTLDSDEEDNDDHQELDMHKVYLLSKLYVCDSGRRSGRLRFGL